jgi:hypothetical protein
MSEETGKVIHQHESSNWWIAGVAIAIAFSYVGEKAVSAWKEIEMKKLSSATTAARVEKVKP